MIWIVSLLFFAALFGTFIKCVSDARSLCISVGKAERKLFGTKLLYAAHNGRKAGTSEKRKNGKPCKKRRKGNSGKDSLNQNENNKTGKDRRIAKKIGSKRRRLKYAAYVLAVGLLVFGCLAFLRSCRGQTNARGAEETEYSADGREADIPSGETGSGIEEEKEDVRRKTGDMNGEAAVSPETEEKEHSDTEDDEARWREMLDFQSIPEDINEFVRDREETAYSLTKIYYAAEETLSSREEQTLDAEEKKSLRSLSLRVQRENSRYQSGEGDLNLLDHLLVLRGLYTDILELYPSCENLYRTGRVCEDLFWEVGNDEEKQSRLAEIGNAVPFQLIAEAASCFQRFFSKGSYMVSASPEVNIYPEAVMYELGKMLYRYWRVEGQNEDGRKALCAAYCMMYEVSRAKFYSGGKEQKNTDRAMACYYRALCCEALRNDPRVKLEDDLAFCREILEQLQIAQSIWKNDGQKTYRRERGTREEAERMLSRTRLAINRLEHAAETS